MEKVEKKLKEGDEVIFLLPNHKLMEKVKVESIDKKGGFALLANKVKVTRTLSTTGEYPRLDGKEGSIFPLTEEREKEFQAYRSWHSVKRNLEALNKFAQNLKLENQETMDLIIELDKKITKIIAKYL